MEEFFPIPDYDGYFINKLGQILSKRKYKEGRIMKPIMEKNGYYIINLYKDKKHKTMSIHRLMGEIFIPNDNNLPYIDHIDRCKTNNSLSNLRWCSYELNNQNRTRPKDNKLGHKHINLWIDKRNDNEWYRFNITRNGKTHDKRFKTLEDAIKYKIEYLTDLGEEII